MSFLEILNRWHKRAALLLTLGLTACPMQPLELHCEQSSECGSGEVCYKHTCLRTCNSKADCPSAADVCVDGVCAPRRDVDTDIVLTDLAISADSNQRADVSVWDSANDAGSADREVVDLFAEDALAEDSQHFEDGTSVEDGMIVDAGTFDAVPRDITVTDVLVVDVMQKDVFKVDTVVNDASVNDLHMLDSADYDAGGRQIYEVQRATGIVIDGDLHDWPAIDAIQFADDSGRELRDNSAVVRLLWDDTALYVAYAVRDTELIALATDADGPGVYLDDCAEFYLDTLADAGTWLHSDDYHFMLNINNVLADARLADRVWDAQGWQSAVVLNGSLNVGDDDSGYNVEIKLPWNGMSAVPSDGTVMGLDLCVSDADTGDGYQYFDWADLDDFARPDDWNLIRFHQP